MISIWDGCVCPHGLDIIFLKGAQISIGFGFMGSLQIIIMIIAENFLEHGGRAIVLNGCELAVFFSLRECQFGYKESETHHGEPGVD